MVLRDECLLKVDWKLHLGRLVLELEILWRSRSKLCARSFIHPP